jgi:hypothetical protein
VLPWQSPSKRIVLPSGVYCQHFASSCILSRIHPLDANLQNPSAPCYGRESGAFAKLTFGEPNMPSICFLDANLQNPSAPCYSRESGAFAKLTAGEPNLPSSTKLSQTTPTITIIRV